MATLFVPIPPATEALIYVRPPDVPWHLVDIQTPETLEEKADRIADQWGASREKLRNLIYYESRWNPNAEGDHGCSWGLVQINLCVHTHISKENALDPEFAINYAAQAIFEGIESKWTVCNCYSLVRSEIGDELPMMADIQPSGFGPEVGGVAIFYYTDKLTGETVKHIALIVAVEDGGFWIFEANFEGCKVGKRFIENDDPNFAGTWLRG